MSVNRVTTETTEQDRLIRGFLIWMIGQGEKGAVYWETDMLGVPIISVRCVG